MIFQPEWRKRKSDAFVLGENSTATEVVSIPFWKGPRPVYANANLSIYSAQTCNARCPFCVEELRPSSRGVELSHQKILELDDARYFRRLEESLALLRPLNPSVSMTGGEISKDPRLPRILRTLQEAGSRQRTLTTNGSGLLDVHEGRTMVEWIASTGVKHLNISLAHYDLARSQKIMRFNEGPDGSALREIVRKAQDVGTSVRLSCVLLKDEVDSVEQIRAYADFALSVGVTNVIFRQLMKTDAAKHLLNYVVKYSDQKRMALEPILDQLSLDSRFELQKQIVGYYYYVEVWKYRGVDLVFEEADLAQLEIAQAKDPSVVHELIFHPNAVLRSSWQPWDGPL